MGDDIAALPGTRTREVMAAIDSDGHGPRLVIADISVDEAWLSVRAATAACLADWR